MSIYSASSICGLVRDDFVREDGIAVFALTGGDVSVETLRESIESAYIRLYYDYFPALSRYMKELNSIDRRLDAVIEDLDILRVQHERLSELLNKEGNLPNVHDLTS